MLRPSQIARELGITPTTVSRWGKKRPRYAVAFVELYEDHEELRIKYNDLKRVYAEQRFIMREILMSAKIVEKDDQLLGEKE